MAGLTDMEELIATVPEKEIADYLREALVCYGAGAHRGCVVLTHTALFEGLRSKLHAVATVNAKAKAVLAIIDPLANGQKVFESMLIDQMKAGSIITQLEADILGQLNKQRNKAAHPSGHVVTAEEARFVFSEAIQKFLSKPIRQTSVLVDAIVAKLPEPNFFPSAIMTDIKLVVDQETQNLDVAGIPQLVAKLVDVLEGTDVAAAGNATRFLLALANRKDTTIRGTIVKSFLTPKASKDVHAAVVTAIVSSDPEILGVLPPATRIRVAALLQKNAEALGVKTPFAQLRNPAHALAMSVTALGEAFMTSNFKEFTEWVIEQSPTSPEFIKALSTAPGLLATLQKRYRAQASHSQFDVSNAFAALLPGMDTALETVSTDEDAFRLLAAVAKGADWGSYGAIELASNKFKELPELRKKGLAFLAAQPLDAAKAVEEAGLWDGMAKFLAKYINEDPQAEAAA
jgi:hypothetical protein